MIDLSNVLIVDTETGGLNPDTDAVLQIAIVTGDLRERLDVKVRDIHGRRTPEAMAVNRIDWTEHVKNALSYGDACGAINAFIERISTPGADWPKNKPVPRKYLAGHNVAFDQGFVRRCYKMAEAASKQGEFTFQLPRLFGPHRTIDTHSILWTLATCGKIPFEATSSEGAFRFFRIEVAPEQRHSAIGDAVATAELLRKLIETIKNDAEAAEGWRNKTFHGTAR